MTNSTDLAPGTAAGRATGRGGRYLTFVIGGQVFALGILDITEILAFRTLTAVPMMPAFLRGVINLRGRVVPVVDMATRFGMNTTEISRRTSIIIVEAAGRLDDGSETALHQDIGIMVDAVNEVIHLDDADIEPPPHFGAGIRADFISGMAKYRGDFTIILDIDRVLSLDELMALGQAAAGAADGGAE
ncbi:chemotaxis protein CheW [Mangrovihabitans endophyticus]|uniref:Chemotaxis protein CheW n=1 Tax=Mangrovihabitans endophyticus TaxID=1751298 RepID=A0A8J3FQH5_9ACTN|nr:chemotaxis protein CheW [Mangrovihabitans endophyticus]GGL07449.1 chemotaxis protein CheW [Mangrovihabitans endophyticus]